MLTNPAFSPSDQRPLPGWSPEELRYELKFVGPAHLGDASAAQLRTVCRPDPRFPENFVHTVYFDSPRLRSYEEKAAGDYRKAKYRLRWYADAAGRSGSTAWLEIKVREGSRVRKRRNRLELAMPAAALTPSVLRRLAVGAFPELVMPTCYLSYRRLRLTTHDDRFRVAVDRDIRVAWVAEWLPTVAVGSVLPIHVVELKGPTLDCGPLLRGMVGRCARSTGISKYALCIERARGGIPP